MSNKNLIVKYKCITELKENIDVHIYVLKITNKNKKSGHFHNLCFIMGLVENIVLSWNKQYE